MLSNCCQRFEKPSNETLLWVAFASFLGFTLVQSIVAFIAESQAMMGDSAAMFVDCLTYGFNLYAEREKKEMREEVTKHGIERSDSGDEDERVLLETHLNLRRRHLHLELFPPVISVSILIVVTVLVLKSSIESLILDASRSQDEQGEPNLEIMMAFCIINVFVDGMNVFCFARAKHLAGYNTESEGDIRPYNTVEGRLSLGASEEDDDDDDDDVEDTRVNLNMCSAYTHVFADSLRTIAVLVTTITAELVDGLTPEVADSSAAVFVSIVILLSLLPLVKGIFKTACELRTLSRQTESIGRQQQLVDFVGEEDEAGGVEIT